MSNIANVYNIANQKFLNSRFADRKPKSYIDIMEDTNKIPEIDVIRMVQDAERIRREKGQPRNFTGRVIKTSGLFNRKHEDN